jgi:hypothetical protein
MKPFASRFNVFRSPVCAIESHGKPNLKVDNVCYLKIAELSRNIYLKAGI